MNVNIKDKIKLGVRHDHRLPIPTPNPTQAEDIPIHPEHPEQKPIPPPIIVGSSGTLPVGSDKPNTIMTTSTEPTNTPIPTSDLPNNTATSTRDAKIMLGILSFSIAVAILVAIIILVSLKYKNSRSKNVYKNTLAHSSSFAGLMDEEEYGPSFVVRSPSYQQRFDQANMYQSQGIDQTDGHQSGGIDQTSLDPIDDSSVDHESFSFGSSFDCGDLGQWTFPMLYKAPNYLIPNPRVQELRDSELDSNPKRVSDPFANSMGPRVDF